MTTLDVATSAVQKAQANLDATRSFQSNDLGVRQTLQSIINAQSALLSAVQNGGQ